MSKESFVSPVARKRHAQFPNLCTKEFNTSITEMHTENSDIFLTEDRTRGARLRRERKTLFAPRDDSIALCEGDPYFHTMKKREEMDIVLH